MTQMHTVIAGDVDVAAYALSDFNPYVEQADEMASKRSLKDATIKILYHAFWLASQKKLNSSEYKKFLKKSGWKGEEKKYLKIATAFSKFSPEDLAQIEPATIFQLANESKKYQEILEQLLDLPEITQAELRKLIKQHQPKPAKVEKPSIWRRTKNGGRYCQIPPIHEDSEQTGVTLQQMMDAEGLTAQSIVAEAIALRKQYKEGRVVLVEKTA